MYFDTENDINIDEQKPRLQNISEENYLTYLDTSVKLEHNTIKCEPLNQLMEVSNYQNDKDPLNVEELKSKIPISVQETQKNGHKCGFCDKVFSKSFMLDRYILKCHKYDFF